MSAKYVLVIDAGTSGVRCLVVDLEGRTISLGRQRWDYQSPDDIAPLGKEFDPEAFDMQYVNDVLKGMRIR